MTGWEDDVRERAWEALAPGFTTRSEVVEMLREWADDDPESGVDPDGAEDVVHELWAQRERQLATEPARRPTDDQRVADAFAALDAGGLVARMNCGWETREAHEECRELARREGRVGYVFFHGQDTERLAHPGATLYLGFDAVPTGRRDRFGSPEENDAAGLAIGHRVAQTMLAHGLDVRWDLDPTARIQLVGIDWRRPLPPG